MPKTKTDYSTRELAQLAGVTERQLQWWGEQDILKPVTHKSHRRTYSHSQLETVRAVARLKGVGLTPWKATKVLRRRVDIEGLIVAIRAVRAAGLNIR